MNLSDIQRLKALDLDRPVSKVLTVITQKTAPTEAQIDKIRPFLLREFMMEDLYIRQMWLANDQVDRSNERFDLGHLARFAETIVGKSVLTGHDYGNVPIGRFFDAEVIKDDKNGWQWVAPWFYMPKSEGNQLDRDNIDAGVLSYVSIGARVDYAGLICDICKTPYYYWLISDESSAHCPHILGREYDGQVCTATYDSTRSDMSKVEAVEGSIVYLGCQYDAAIAKSAEQSQELNKRKSEIITLSANTPPVRRDEEGSSLTLEELLKAIGADSPEAVIKMVEELKQKNAELTTKASGLEKDAEDGQKLKTALVEEIKGHMAFLGKSEAEIRTIDHIQSPDDLLALNADFEKQRAEKADASRIARGEQPGADESSDNHVTVSPNSSVIPGW